MRVQGQRGWGLFGFRVGCQQQSWYVCGSANRSPGSGFRAFPHSARGNRTESETPVAVFESVFNHMYIVGRKCLSAQAG